MSAPLIVPNSELIESVTILRAPAADFPDVQAFYASVGYFEAFTADYVVITAKAQDKIIGVVRERK